MSTDDGIEPISISTMAEGAAVEMVDTALREAWLNIRDPNTDAKAKRQVQLTVTLIPDQDRVFVSTVVDVTTKLAKDSRPMMTRVELVRNRGGEVTAVELRSRQMELDVQVADVTPIRTQKGGVK